MLYEALQQGEEFGSTDNEEEDQPQPAQHAAATNSDLVCNKGVDSSSESEHQQPRNLFRPRDRSPSLPRSSPGDSDGPDLGTGSSSDETPSPVNYRRPRAACSKHDFANIAHHDTRMRSKITRQGDAAIKLYSRAMAKRRNKLQEIQQRIALKRGLDAGMDEAVLREVLEIACKNNEDLFVKEVRSCRKLVARMTGIKSMLIDRCINNCRAFDMNEAKKGLQVTTECEHCGQPRYKVRNFPVSSREWLSRHHILQAQCRQITLNINQDVLTQ